MLPTADTVPSAWSITECSSPAAIAMTSFVTGKVSLMLFFPFGIALTEPFLCRTIVWYS